MPFRYHLIMRSKKETSSFEDGVVRFALRDPKTGLYWDCKWPEAPRKRYHWERPRKPADFVPVFKSTPTHHQNTKKLSTTFTRYEIERQIRDDALPALPPLELVELRLEFRVATTSDIEVDDNLIQIERIRRKFGKMVGDAAESLVNRGENISEFGFAIKRKGCSLLTVLESMPGARNAGMITFLRSDTDLVHVELLISEDITKVYRLKET